MDGGAQLGRAILKQKASGKLKILPNRNVIDATRGGGNEVV